MQSCVPHSSTKITTAIKPRDLKQSQHSLSISHTHTCIPNQSISHYLLTLFLLLFNYFSLSLSLYSVLSAFCCCCCRCRVCVFSLSSNDIWFCVWCICCFIHENIYRTYLLRALSAVRISASALFHSHIHTWIEYYMYTNTWPLMSLTIPLDGGTTGKQHTISSLFHIHLTH